MKKFILKDLSSNLNEELANIGYDSSYIFEGIKKFQYRNFKILYLDTTQANILKQTALSVGADCATNKNTITGKIDHTDCILGGNISQLKRIALKLKLQPFNLKNLGQQLENILNNSIPSMLIRNTLFDFSRPYIVGILNLGQSFSDGYTDTESGKKQFIKLIEDGADIIDIGAESTKAYSSPVDSDIQISKIKPILKFSKSYNIPISIDTRSSKVARFCLENGADMINDVSGFEYDNEMLDVISEFKSPVIIQHSSATPDIMQEKITYKNLLDDIFITLNNKIEIAKKNGINNIIIDPGIGFGKTREQSLKIIKYFEDFKTLNLPIMLGTSRKSFLNIKNDDNNLKDIMTLAIDSILISKGINFIRVHNVALHKKLLETIILE